MIKIRDEDDEHVVNDVVESHHLFCAKDCVKHFSCIMSIPHQDDEVCIVVIFFSEMRKLKL